MHRALLGEHVPVLAAEHVQDDKIVMAVTIDVGKIQAHGKIAGRAQHQVVQSAEMAPAVVNPATIRSECVVTNVDIGSAITVEVAKHHGQTLIPRSLLE